MTYMKDIAIWLNELWLEVTDGEISQEDFQKQVKEKILESYHNGLDTKEYRYSLTDKGRELMENSSQEEPVKKETRSEAKPRRFWPHRGRAQR